MQASACLIGAVVEFSACMEGGKNHSLRRDSLLVHLHRDTSPIVPHGAGAIRLQRHPDRCTLACQMLVHRIIDNLIYQVVQPLGSHSSNLHAGALANRLQPFQYGNAVRVILCFAHDVPPYLCINLLSNLLSDLLSDLLSVLLFNLLFFCLFSISSFQSC